MRRRRRRDKGERRTTKWKWDADEKAGKILLRNKIGVYLWGVVDDKTASEVITKMLLLDADKPGEEIKFYINSPGGVVTSGMVIYDTMQMIKSPVSTICMGLAASMGSILLSGGEKGKRYIYPSWRSDDPSAKSWGIYAGRECRSGNHRQNKPSRVKDIGARILADNCGKKIEQIMRDFDRDYWMEAKEAIEYGIVIKIVDKIDKPNSILAVI